ncbi:MAG TPA: histidinol-phosphatase HisJ family protein [Thermomicrobiaceae bacterium]|nr:histidinol-phosphatase HisJ family protein [Thermomicrobiaceae bacterium]
MPTSSIPHDYHLHTHFSVDSEMTLDELCETAIALGIGEICPTEHADFVPEDDGCGYYDPDGYFGALLRRRERYDGRLTIRAGVEIGEAHRFPECVQPLTSRYPYDFVIGSLHWVGSESVMTPQYFAGKTPEQAYGPYFDELLALVRDGDLDVVGHLDVPKRYAPDEPGGFDAARHEEQIRTVLRACVDRGIGIEINTGTARRPVGVPSPGIEVLRWYRELGGEILTVGSDGHRPQHVGYRLDHALALARAAGFSHLATFEARRPRFVPIG